MSAKRSSSKKGADAPLILVSNDDGVRAEGILALARALAPLGRVVVVAPDQERSASSHSITLHRPLRVEGLGPDVYTVDGTPTDCVMLAVHGILSRRPDLIISGVNHGPNLGDDVHYSGTVSVAFEGGILGIPSVAVSSMNDGCGNVAAAAEVGAVIARKVLEEGLPEGIVLNVNVPDMALDEMRGISFTRQGKRHYGGVIVEKTDPRGKKYYWIGGDQSGFDDMHDSDCTAVREGFVSVTPLRVNITDGTQLERLSRWKIRLGGRHATR